MCFSRWAALAVAFCVCSPTSFSSTRLKARAVRKVPRKPGKARRTFWELDAVWRSVELVERGAGGSRPVLKERATPGRGSHTPSARLNRLFAGAVAGNLKNFLRSGKSSLTVYEASMLARGFGVEGNQRDHGMEGRRGVVRGDRVTLRVREHGARESFQTSGIVVNGGAVLTVRSNGDFAVYYPEFDNGSEGRALADIVEVAGPALDDGRRPY